MPGRAINNVAVDGSTIVQLLASYPTKVAQFYHGNAHDDVSIWASTNDIASGATPAQAYANLTSYIQAAHATGFKVITATMLSRVGLDTQKNALNSLILANTAGADGIVDFTATPLGIDGGYANPTYFTGDFIHPTLFSRQTIEAPAFQAAVLALL